MASFQRALFHSTARRSAAGAISVAALVSASACFLENGKHSDKSTERSSFANDLRCPVTTTCDSSAPTKIFTADQVSQHNGANNKETWVSYQGKVYDITDFIKEHPGGEVIRDASGGPIENYWAYWAYHTACKKPAAFLKQYEIGQLKQDEDMDNDSIESLTDEMYAADPDRAKCEADGQVALSVRPWSSETLPQHQNTPFTSNESFYVRNHAPVPLVDSDDYDVSIECDASILHEKHTKNKLELSFHSIQRDFPTVTINSTLQCAGNRGADMVKVAPTAFSGTPYENIRTGMMGHASWAGVRLVDVLNHAFPGLDGITEDEIDSCHVEFEGVDGYKTSTPLRRILDKSFDAMLAWEMNGEPLPPDHGGPIRVLLPGIAGARNVKWVCAIRIQRHECDSCFQRSYYLDMHGRPIQEMPMQCFMTSKTVTDKDTLSVAGVAWGGGSGVGISRVEVSSDNGKSWKEATIKRIPRSYSEASREWSWVRFSAQFDLDPKRDKNLPLPTVTSRAFDGTGLQQPEQIWYPKGYLSNGWHRV